MNLVEATLAERRRTARRCSPSATSGIRLAVDRAVAALPKASKVTFGVRPRAFTPRRRGVGATISGAVEMIEPMGAETLIHRAHRGRSTCASSCRARSACGRATSLHLACDPSQVHIFDEAGKAVRS